MATARGTQTRSPMKRPVPGPANLGSPADTRDYTENPPGGPTYPWHKGGGSREYGTPDNWADYYPTEGHGRGDSWISVKTAPGGRLNKDTPHPATPGASPGLFTGTGFGPRVQAPGTSGGWGSQGEDRFGQPGEQAAGGSPPNNLEQVMRRRGIKPGPLTNIGGAKGSGGYWTGDKVNPPKGAAAGKEPLPFSNEQLTPQFGKMKKGETVTLDDGKTYFKNQNGAVVDVTDPRAKKRVTDRQGRLIGQAAVPPPGATPPAATPPPTGGTPRVPIGTQPPPTGPGQRPIDQPPPTAPPPPQYPQVTQEPYQYDPFSMNQFAYPQSGGPGPYGWNPGYGGTPFNYSFNDPYSNPMMQQSLMQGMYGGGYGMPQQQFGFDLYSMDFGGGDPYAQQMMGYF